MSTIVEKKDIPIIEGETKIPFLAVICGSINFFIWIKAKIEHRNWLLKNLDLKKKIGTPKDAYIIPIQPLELQRTHI